MHEVRHATVASQLLLGHKHYVDRSLEGHLLSLEVPQRAQVLHANALHVLSAASENPPRLVHDGIERLVGPILLENRHNVHVGIEDDRLKFWLSSNHRQNDDGLAGRHWTLDLHAQAEILAEAYEKLNAWLCGRETALKLALKRFTVRDQQVVEFWLFSINRACRI